MRFAITCRSHASLGCHQMAALNMAVPVAAAGCLTINNEPNALQVGFRMIKMSSTLITSASMRHHLQNVQAYLEVIVH